MGLQWVCATQTLFSNNPFKLKVEPCIWNVNCNQIEAHKIDIGGNQLVMMTGIDC